MYDLLLLAVKAVSELRVQDRARNSWENQVVVSRWASVVSFVNGDGIRCDKCVEALRSCGGDHAHAE